MSFDYYLGANTPNGFISCFEEMTNAVSRLYIIKGGPGCGKSTAMKRIAALCEAADVAVQRIWCSSDTKSLDGVYIPELDTLYVDGTAPHVIEPNCPGARDGILNFGDFWDSCALSAQRSDIEQISREISHCYLRMYQYLSAAGALAKIYFQQVRQSVDLERISRRARRISAQQIPVRRGKNRGRQIPVYLNTLSPDGPVFLGVPEDYTICEVHDGYGLYSFVTGPVLEHALTSGYTVYAAHDPLFPNTAPLHLVIPELRFALLTSGGTFGCPPTGRRRIRLDMMTDGSESKPAAIRRKKDRFCYDQSIQAACEALTEAKLLHDELEGIYRPTVDFSRIDAFMDRHCEELLEKLTRRKHDCQS